MSLPEMARRGGLPASRARCRSRQKCFDAPPGKFQIYTPWASRPRFTARSIMSANVFFRRTRPACAGRIVLAVSALWLAADIHPAAAQADARAETTVFTIIVTRHGVRAISPMSKRPGPDYQWADWSPVAPDDLTAHGYRLITLMGAFYRDAQAAKRLPLDCKARTAYVYADTAQRTLGTAHALIE